MLWLLAGIVLFSDMGRLHPRYTEALTPAVAATLGIGLAWATERRDRDRLLALSVTVLVVALYAERLLFGTSTVWWITAAAAVGAIALAWSGFPRGDTPRAGVTALALLCILAIPLWASLNAVRENVSDTNPLGILHHGELAPLSAYLRAHQGGAYYEVGVRLRHEDGRAGRARRPPDPGADHARRPRLHLARAAARTRGRGQGPLRLPRRGLRAAIAPHRPRLLGSCPLGERTRHDVSKQAGMPRPGMLWRS